MFMNTTLPTLYRSSHSRSVVDYSQRLNQFARFKVCRDQVLMQEKLVNVPYAWIIRTRPDIFYEQPIPSLSSLRSDAVSGRLRCLAGKSTLPHEVFTDSAVHRPSHGEVPRVPKCREVACAGRTYMDDQFAFVPRVLLDSYFIVDCRPERRINFTRYNESMKQMQQRGTVLDTLDCSTTVGSVLMPTCTPVHLA